MKVPKAVKLPSGNWRLSIMIDGQRISITAATKKEAERQAAALKSGAIQAKDPEPEALTLTKAIDG